MSNIYNKTLEAVNALFNDTSQSKESTLEDLRGLKDEIDIMIEAINFDIEKEKRGRK